jgi:hypothetical protein
MRSGAGWGEDAKEACGQEHDGGVAEDGGILQLAQNLLNISNYLLVEVA